MNGLALLSVFVAACSYGVLSSIVKMSYKMGYTFEQMTGLQLLVGTLLLVLYLLIFRATKIKIYLPKTKKDIWGVFLLGATTAGTSILYYKSVVYLPASFSVLLLMQFSWINLLLEWIIFKVKPSLQAIIATIVIVFGTILASGVLSSNAEISWIGILYGLGAGLSFAIFLLSNGRFLVKTPSIYKAGFMGLIASTIFIIIFPPFWINIEMFSDTNLMGLGLLIGFFGVVVPPLLLGYGMPKVGVTAGSIVSTAELPVALIAAVLIAGESISFVQWIGAAIIFMGIIGSKVKFKKEIAL